MAKDTPEITGWADQYVQDANNFANATNQLRYLTRQPTDRKHDIIIGVYHYTDRTFLSSRLTVAELASIPPAVQRLFEDLEMPTDSAISTTIDAISITNLEWHLVSSRVNRGISLNPSGHNTRIVDRFKMNIVGPNQVVNDFYGRVLNAQPDHHAMQAIIIEGTAWLVDTFDKRKAV